MQIESSAVAGKGDSLSTFEQNKTKKNLLNVNLRNTMIDNKAKKTKHSK